jgi:hypothetical protein
MGGKYRNWVRERQWNRGNILNLLITTLGVAQYRYVHPSFPQTYKRGFHVYRTFVQLSRRPLRMGCRCLAAVFMYDPINWVTPVMVIPEAINHGSGKWI